MPIGTLCTHASPSVVYCLFILLGRDKFIFPLPHPSLLLLSSPLSSPSHTSYLIIFNLIVVILSDGSMHTLFSSLSSSSLSSSPLSSPSHYSCYHIPSHLISSSSILLLSVYQTDPCTLSSWGYSNMSTTYVRPSLKTRY